MSFAGGPLSPGPVRRVAVLYWNGAAENSEKVGEGASGRRDPAPGDPDVSDPLEDGSVEHPFDAIQEAVDAAPDGSTIVVLDGTYVGFGNRDIDFAGRALTLQSLNGAPNCIIANTTKGKGVSFIEDRKEWHHKIPTDEQYEQAVAELEGSRP